ncbi:MAG: hypothetical protein HYS27_19500 [Deltaproteobacteria bacterium]|nr:hypothetical protein [Deltaproteobacteria bacterium]
MTSSTASQVTVSDEGEGRLVTVRGAITEATDFTAALSAGPKRVTVELSGVDRVNSFGVRGWIRFVKALSDAGVACTLDGVSVAMVRQMNMIPQARGGAAVRTIYAPYYCEQCDDERALTLAAGATSAPEQATCPSCGGVMEFDDVQATYFAFLGEQRAS